MGRRRTVRKNNGHTRGSSLMYVVLLMTLLAVLSSGYMAISRYNMKAALKNRRYMEAQLSAKTIHRSFCEAVSSGESPAMNLIWQNFQEDCDRVREEFDAMMDEEEAEEGEDGELKAESFSSEEDTDTTDAEEELRWERYLYHALGNKKYVVRGKGCSEDSGGTDDGAADAPAADGFTTDSNITDSTTTIDITLTAHPLKSLATVRTRVESSGYSFSMMAEWYKQLFGESEGKEHKGLFPASVEFTADLHSMGQYIQQGERSLFETVVRFGASHRPQVVPLDETDGDGLNFLAGKDVDFIRTQAMDGTLLAHVEGGVPNIILRTGQINAFTLGELIYFFEYACGLSGYLLDVNPFDQPGVEAYKKNMFALLGKPGYEALRQELAEKLHRA